MVYFFLIAIFLWLAGLSFYLYKIASHYQKLAQRTNKDNLLEALDKILDTLDNNQADIEGLKKELRKLSDEATSHVQKVGILRFNPFADTGGNQSFVLAILDGADTGIVLTSLHSRGITRWYAKNVKEGEGVDHKLSEEEAQVIKQAVLLKQKIK